MIITSAHHPDLFKAEMLEVPGFAHWMSEHLLHMSHSHLIVTNDRVGLRARVDAMSRDLLHDDVAEVFRKKFSRMADKSRILECGKEFDPARHTNVIDVVLAPDESDSVVQESMKTFGVGRERVSCWSDYRKNALCRNRGPNDESASRVELRAMSAHSIKHMNRDNLEYVLLRPQFALAPSVHIIDKIIGKAFLNAREEKKRDQVRTWESFRCALQMIFRAWVECCRLEEEERGCFLIVTEMKNRKDFQEKFEDEMRDVFMEIDTNEANKFSVDWKDGRDEMAEYDAEHDRYLETCRHRILFSAGFDLFERPGKGDSLKRARCSQGTVSFYDN
jgi:hypothetical protein